MIALLAVLGAHADPASGTLENAQDLDRDEATVIGADVFQPERQGIINGTPATLESWPQTGALILEAQVMGMQVSTLACSSSLIAPDTVLLAAHCIDPTLYAQQGIDINASELYWTRDPNPGMMTQTLPADAVRVAHRVRHEDFSIMTMSMGIAQNADIALLYLETALTEVPLAVLPTVEEASQIVVDAPVVVVGWGQTSTAQTSAGNKVYGVSHIAELGTHELKVGEVVTDVRKCHGDSGGPTFLEIDTEAIDTWRQIGVTSHAYDMSDCEQTGGVDTRVDPYLPWIDAQMTAACTDGRRVWCETPGVILPAFPGDGEEARACGCASSGAPAMWLGWLGLPLMWRRRARGAR